VTEERVSSEVDTFDTRAWHCEVQIEEGKGDGRTNTRGHSSLLHLFHRKCLEINVLRRVVVHVAAVRRLAQPFRRQGDLCVRTNS